MKMDISMSYFDVAKFLFKALKYKWQQRRLCTNEYNNVETKLGSVKGVKRFTIWGDTYYSYERIPFAKPPIGDLRFKAPVPAEPWDGLLDCTNGANKPMQATLFLKKYDGSEDCLYLNVYVKHPTPSTLSPVMIWIYGGGFQTGEASRDMCSPDFFMWKNIILVTIAYRLGAFGFLSLTDPELNVPGNAGLKDQILGLRWVKENIAAFGGDPNNITLFGISAGAVSAHLLTLTAQSKGLFHKLIIMSGSALCPWARSPPNNWAYRLAQNLGYVGENNDKDIFKFIQAANGGEIAKVSIKIQSKEEKINRIVFPFGPVVEPYVTEQCIISEEPRELMRKTYSNSVPMMIGGTSFEGLLFYSEVTIHPELLTAFSNCKSLLPLDLKDKLDGEIRDKYALRLKKAYFGDESSILDDKLKFLDLESYREFWHPMYRIILSRLQEGSASTYLYRFDYDSKFCNTVRNLVCGPKLRGVCHGDDMSYIFPSIISNPTSAGTPEYQIQRTMIDIWTSFAIKGNPNCESISKLNFAPLEKGTKNLKCLNISEQISYIDLPELEKLNVWNSFYPNDML